MAGEGAIGGVGAERADWPRIAYFDTVGEVLVHVRADGLHTVAEDIAMAATHAMARWAGDRTMELGRLIALARRTHMLETTLERVADGVVWIGVAGGGESRTPSDAVVKVWVLLVIVLARAHDERAVALAHGAAEAIAVGTGVRAVLGLQTGIRHTRVVQTAIERVVHLIDDVRRTFEEAGGAQTLQAAVVLAVRVGAREAACVDDEVAVVLHSRCVVAGKVVARAHAQLQWARETIFVVDHLGRVSCRLLECQARVVEATLGRVALGKAGAAGTAQSIGQMQVVAAVAAFTSAIAL